MVMAAKLCKTCLAIPSGFWAEQFDRLGFPQGPCVELRAFMSMQSAAAQGCQLCQIFLMSADTDLYPKWDLEGVPVVLWRAVIASHQAVLLTTGRRIDEYRAHRCGATHTTLSKVRPLSYTMLFWLQSIHILKRWTLMDKKLALTDPKRAEARHCWAKTVLPPVSSILISQTRPCPRRSYCV